MESQKNKPKFGGWGVLRWARIMHFQGPEQWSYAFLRSPSGSLTAD
jgi:hypothetical protein